MAGYELFSHSTSDLAPQLYGWYGAPGVAEGKETDLFLVGDHFSVTQSQVLAGNKMVKSHTMISRQVMRITVEKEGMVRSDRKVQINVATPYGVSQDLLVPRIAANEVCKADLSFPSKVEVVVERMCAASTKCKIINANVDDTTAVAWLKWPDEELPAENVAVTLTFPMKGCELVIDTDCAKKLGSVRLFGPMVPLDRNALQEIAGCLMGGVSNCGDCASIDDMIAKGITTTSVKLTDKNGVVKNSVNQLTLTFKCRNRSIACPPGMGCPPQPAPAVPAPQVHAPENKAIPAPPVKGDMGFPPAPKRLNGVDNGPVLTEPKVLAQPLLPGLSMSNATTLAMITLQFFASKK